MVVIQDSRVGESSGLAASMMHPGILYTMDDEGMTPQIFGVSTKTGKTAITIGLDKNAKIQDPEAIRCDRHKAIWLGDIGDNDKRRHDCALLRIPEPGLGDHRSMAYIRYPIEFPDRKCYNAEALALNPITDRKWIITKASTSHLFQVPDKLQPGRANILIPMKPTFGAYVTDAAVTPDGKWLLVRRKKQQYVYVYDMKTWNYVGKISTSKVMQPESIDIDWDPRYFWFGSEGKNSPLIRKALPPEFAPKAA